MGAKSPDIEAALDQQVKQKWALLRLLAYLFGVGSALVLALSIAVGVITMVTPTYDYSFDANNHLVETVGPSDAGRGMGILLVGLLVALGLAAAAQFTRLQIAQEHNARVANVLLAKLLKRRGDE